MLFSSLQRGFRLDFGETFHPFSVLKWFVRPILGKNGAFILRDAFGIDPAKTAKLTSGFSQGFAISLGESNQSRIAPLQCPQAQSRGLFPKWSRDPATRFALNLSLDQISAFELMGGSPTLSPNRSPAAVSVDQRT
jgi:hypothetical protein